MPPKPNQDRLDTLAHKSRGYKAHLTRLINSAKRAADFARTVPPSSLLVTELESHIALINKAYINEDEALSALAREDTPEAFDEYVGKQEDEAERKDEAIQFLLETIARIDEEARPQPVAPPVPAAPHAQVTKANEALKPKVLTRESTPVELHSWLEKFRAYYSTSRMNLASIPEQQAYFRICLDPYLDARLRDKIQETTPIFSQNEDSCIGFLEAEFLLKYPVFTRRLDFFQERQQAGQAFTDFASKIRHKGDESELPALTVDEIYVMRFLTGCGDAKLRERFLRETNPTLQNLIAIAINYEVGNASLKAMTSPASAAAAKSGDYKKQNGNKNQSKEKSTRQDKQNSMKERNLCFRCGRKNEDGHGCKGIDGTCTGCGKKGHLVNVCLSKYDSTGNGQGNSQGRNRNQGQGNSKPGATNSAA
jgi:hypothetical protein